METKCARVIDYKKNSYSGIDCVGKTLSVGKLIEILSKEPHDTPIILHDINDNIYSSIKCSSIYTDDFTELKGE